MERLKSILDSKTFVDKVYVLRDTAIYSGMSEESYVPVCKELVGETIIEDGKTTLKFSEDKPTNPLKIAYDLEKELRAKACNNKTFKNSDSILLTGIDVNGINDFLSYMSDEDRKYYCYITSEVISKRAVKKGISKCLRLLYVGKSNPNLTGLAKTELNKKITIMKETSQAFKDLESIDLEDLIRKVREAVEIDKWNTVQNTLSFDEKVFNSKVYNSRD